MSKCVVSSTRSPPANGQTERDQGCGEPGARVATAPIRNRAKAASRRSAGIVINLVEPDHLLGSRAHHGGERSDIADEVERGRGHVGEDSVAAPSVAASSVPASATEPPAPPAPAEPAVAVDVPPSNI